MKNLFIIFISLISLNSFGQFGTDGGVFYQQTSITLPDIDSLLAYFPFDGDYNDYSGNGYNGTNFNSTFTYDRDSVSTESSVNFVTADSAHIQTSITDTLDYSKPFTIAMWAYVDHIGANINLIGSYVSGLNRLDAGFVDVNQLRVLHGNGVSNTNHRWAGFTIDETWAHLILIYDGTTLSLYINNTLRSPAVGLSPSTSDAVGFVLGATSRATPSAYYNGNMDDVFIYQKALDATERSTIYNWTTETAMFMESGAFDYLATWDYNTIWNYE